MAPSPGGDSQVGGGGGGGAMRTIAEQLAAEGAPPGKAEEYVVPLGRRGGGSADPPAAPPELTIHQKRNIRRQAMLDRVSQRNDVPFFATLLLSVLLPPACILGYAFAAGLIEVPFS